MLATGIFWQNSGVALQLYIGFPISKYKGIIVIIATWQPRSSLKYTSGEMTTFSPLHWNGEIFKCSLLCCGLFYILKCSHNIYPFESDFITCDIVTMFREILISLSKQHIFIWVEICFKGASKLSWLAAGDGCDKDQCYSKIVAIGPHGYLCY